MRAIERKFEAYANPQMADCHQIAKIQNSSRYGRFADITSMISGKANCDRPQRAERLVSSMSEFLGNTEMELQM